MTSGSVEGCWTLAARVGDQQGKRLRRIACTARRGVASLKREPARVEKEPDFLRDAAAFVAIVGWSMSDIQDRHLVLSAVLMACWQRSSHDPLVLHSDRGTQFTCSDYPRFLLDRNITSSMSDVGRCGDNAPAQGFFGMIKRQRIHRRRYLTLAAARSDVFVDIERFHNPRMQRRLDIQDQEFYALTQPSVKTG